MWSNAPSHRSATQLPFTQLNFLKTILQQIAFNPVKKVLGSPALASGFLF
jgi:hypothetical protein